MFLLIGLKRQGKNTIAFPFGTAFSITSKHVLAAYHIIKENKLKDVGIVESLELLSPLEEIKLIRLTVLEFNEEEDLALLERRTGEF